MYQNQMCLLSIFNSIIGDFFNQVLWWNSGQEKKPHQSSTAKLVSRFVREQLRPVIRTEEQFLYLCHLIGPFLQRFHLERTRCLMEVIHLFSCYWSIVA